MMYEKNRKVAAGIALNRIPFPNSLQYTVEEFLIKNNLGESVI
jgi:hypothetical protein